VDFSPRVGSVAAVVGVPRIPARIEIGGKAVKRNQKNQVCRIIESIVMKKLGITLVVLVGIFCVSCRTADTAKDDCVRQSVEYLCDISQWGHPYWSVAETLRIGLGSLGMEVVPYLVQSLSDLPRPGVPTEEPAWADKVGSLTLALRFVVGFPLDGLVAKLIDRVEKHDNSLAPYEDVAEVRERLLERFGYLMGIKEIDQTKKKRIKDLMSSLANENVSVPEGDELFGTIYIGDYPVMFPYLVWFRNAEDFYKARDYTPHPLIQEGGAAVPLLLKEIRQNKQCLKEILIVNAILRRGGPIEVFLSREWFLSRQPRSTMTATLQRQPPDFLVQLERMRLINLLEACERFRASHGKK
jgi:hypothetical protein